jgi:hypothetical protein
MTYVSRRCGKVRNEDSGADRGKGFPDALPVEPQTDEFFSSRKM